MSLTAVLELAGVVGFIIVLVGGKQKRDRGWTIIALIIGLCVAGQVMSMGIVKGLQEHDEHFFPAWYLSKSYTLCSVSWVVQVVAGVGLVASALFLPEEGGYELIPDRARVE